MKGENKFDFNNDYDIATNKIYYYFRQYVYHRGVKFKFSPENNYCRVNIKGKRYIITMDTKNNYFDFIVVDNNAIWIDYVSPAYYNVFDFLNALDYYIKNKKDWDKKHNIFNERNEFKNCIIKVKHGGKKRYKLMKVL